MITVINSKMSELNEFCRMGKQSHVENHLSIKPLKALQKAFKDSNIIFLSIIISPDQLAGYILLVKENDTHNVQLKRILVDERHLGIGQKAIIAMEN